MWFEGSTVADSARRYLYADERGSIVAVTDSSGNVLNVNTYDEYGIPGSGNAGTFQYTGQAWLPELGMYYYKARMHSPTLGRFMQTDPIGYGDGMNMYAYVGNDPVNYIDPTGLCRFYGGTVGDAGPFWFPCSGSVSLGGGFGSGGVASNGRPPMPPTPEECAAFPGSQYCDPPFPTETPQAPAETPQTDDEGVDWSKIGACALDGAKEHYGLTAAAGTSAALATPLPKSIVPPFRNIGTPTTNALSAIGHYVDIPISKVTGGLVKSVTIGGRTSTNLLRIAGRANPVLAAGLAVVDAIAIGVSTYQCYNEQQK